MKYLSESDFEYAFVTMMNKLIYGHKTVLKPLLESLGGINSNDSLASIREIDRKLEENAEQRKVLVGLMTKGYLEPAVYNKRRLNITQPTSMDTQTGRWLGYLQMRTRLMD